MFYGSSVNSRNNRTVGRNLMQTALAKSHLEEALRRNPK
jgi:hypothetical protein